MKSNIVNLNPIDIYYVPSTHGLTGAKNAFKKLESTLSSFKGRKFYGLYFHDGSYHACMKREALDNFNHEILNMGTIPGGLYATTKLSDWPERIHKIGPAFDTLAEIYFVDNNRPSIEFYKSQKELKIYLPVRE